MGAGGIAGGIPGATVGSCAAVGVNAGRVPVIAAGTEGAGGERDRLVGVAGNPAGMTGRQAARARIKNRM